MIVDTSAIMAILLREPEQDDFIRKIKLAPRPSISSGSWIELTVVLERRRESHMFAILDAILAAAPLTIAPVTEDQALIGAAAYRNYGRGNHPARLNYGDCFAYALAKATGQPLLFKGDDFTHTDIQRA